MEPKLILYPLLAMMALTFIVGAVLLSRRVKFLKEFRIHPDKVASPAKMAASGEDTRAADNFRNLFETPVLFYALVITIYAAKLTCAPLIAMAWLYVTARAAHSYIQCGVNKVIPRFYAYLFSSLMLVLMLAMVCYQLLTGQG